MFFIFLLILGIISYVNCRLIFKHNLIIYFIKLYSFANKQHFESYSFTHLFFKFKEGCQP